MESAPDHVTSTTAEDHWRRWTIAFWLLTCAALIMWRWSAIHWFSLGDTDDNLRIAQVRAWLNGQGWYDLRQYRLDPPTGANIHWSRIVDLPIAGLILAVRPFAGGAVAEQAAVAIAPLLALGAAMWASVLAVRRLVDVQAFALGAGLLVAGYNLMLMFMPTRIDHHGWQLAALMTVVAGAADPDRRRGGLTAGVATAFSLAIGLEMLIYLAIAGGVTGLRWVVDRAEATRMAAYGVGLGGGATVGFLAFASIANRAPVCDALSPVWLSVALAAGGVLTLLSAVRAERWQLRFALAAAAAALIAAGFAIAWPHCLGRLEGVSPELDNLWLSHVREARPLWRHGWRTALTVLALPTAGLAGYTLVIARVRGAALMAWATPLLCALAAIGLLAWQTRAGPAAQLLAIPGAAALAWAVLPRLARDRRLAVRSLGVAAAALVVSGTAVAVGLAVVPTTKATTTGKKASVANRRCPTLPALRPIAKLPTATILTFVDLGPRLIAVTHHRAIAGPYHRNQAAILDVQHAFRGPADTARDVVRRHGVTLVLICPGMSESTIYRAENPRGFYAQLAKGRVPAWLAPVALPRNSPFKLWRVVG